MMSKHKHRKMNNKENLTEEELKRQDGQHCDEPVSDETESKESKEQQATETEAPDKQEESTCAKAEAKTEEPDPLKAAEEKIAELQDKYLRSIAEFDNYRKRTSKEKDELRLNGSEKAISAILPIVDDMERAIDNADKVEDLDAIKEGMTLIYQKFQKALKELGLKKIETDGADFDTDYHEAIAMVPGMGDDKKGKILDCVQTGYQLNDKVIRHAKVAVGQ